MAEFVPVEIPLMKDIKAVGSASAAMSEMKRIVPVQGSEDLLPMQAGNCLGLTGTQENVVRTGKAFGLCLAVGTLNSGWAEDAECSKNENLQNCQDLYGWCLN